MFLYETKNYVYVYKIVFNTQYGNDTDAANIRKKKKKICFAIL